MIVNKYNQGGGGSGSGMTPQQVQQQIDTSLNPYWDSGETKDYVDEAVSGISLEGYYTSAQTEEAITSKGYASQDQVDEIDEVVAESLNDLQAKIDELSGATPSIDLSGYYTSAQTEEAISSALTPYYTSAQTEEAIAEALSGFTPGSDNYVERAESESTLIIPTNINENENDAYIGTFEDGFAYRFSINNERLSNIHNTRIDEDGNVTGHRFANEEYPIKDELNFITNSLKPIVLQGPQYDVIPDQEPGTVVPTMRYEGIYWNKTDGFSEYSPRDISLWIDSGAHFTKFAYSTNEDTILNSAEKIGDINYIAGWNGAENVAIYNEIYGFADKANAGNNCIAVKTRYCDEFGTEIASDFTAMLIEDGNEGWHYFDVGDGYNYGIHFNVLADMEDENKFEVVFEPHDDDSEYEGEDFFECYRMVVDTKLPDGNNSYFDGLKYYDPHSGDWENINKPVQDQIDTLDEVVAESLNDLNERVTVLEVSGGTPSVDLSGYYTSAQTEDAISAATSGKADAVSVSGNTNKAFFPAWNEQGIITGRAANNNTYKVTMNGGEHNYYGPDGFNWSFYAPKTSGSAGEFLVADGTSTPKWSAVTIPDMSNYYTSAETFTSAQTQSAITAATQNMVTSTTITTMWRGTQAAYDTATQSGATADPNTFYIILPSA